MTTEKLFFNSIPDGSEVRSLGRKILLYPKTTKIYQRKEFFTVPSSNITIQFGIEKPSFAAVSNHIGLKIFQVLGFRVPETVLCRKSPQCDEYDILCLTENLWQNGQKFNSFEECAVYIPDILVTKILNNIEIIQPIMADVSQNLKNLNFEAVENFFWEMFVVDAYLGMDDRNAATWGFLYLADGTYEPMVYDSRRCLFAHYDYREMAEFLTYYEDNKKIVESVTEDITSCLCEHNQQINYAQYFRQNDNSYCRRALVKIVSKINDEKVDAIIDAEPFINPLHKKFLKIVLRERKKKILLAGLERKDE